MVETGEVRDLERPQGTSEHRRQLAGEAVLAPQVRAVGEALVVDLEDQVNGGDQPLQRRPGGHVPGDLEQTLVPVRQAELAGGAEHPLAPLPTDLRHADGDASGEGDPRSGERGPHSGPHVGRAADGGEGAVAAGDPGCPQGAVVAADRKLLHRQDLRDDDPADEALELLEALDLGGGHGQAVGHAVG